MSTRLIAIIVAGVLGLFLLFSSVFVVDLRHQAIVLQFGELKRTVQTPGLHFKIPFLQNVIYMDRRILSLDLQKQEVIASDEKRLEVDALVRWRIADPVEFYKTVQGNENTARARLTTTAVSNLRQVLASAEFTTLLSEERSKLMQQISARVGASAQTYGVEIIDVRIKRADLPENVSIQVFNRMQREYNEQAAERRASGQEEARRIRSEAEKERTILLAEARKESEIIRGEGDSQAVRIFAEAFGRDADFFEFYRTMQAYQQAMNQEDTTLVLSPESEFFKYLQSMNGAR